MKKSHVNWHCILKNLSAVRTKTKKVGKGTFMIDSDDYFGDPDYACNASDEDIDEIVKTVTSKPSTSKCRPKKGLIRIFIIWHANQEKKEKTQ